MNRNQLRVLIIMLLMILVFYIYTDLMTRYNPEAPRIDLLTDEWLLLILQTVSIHRIFHLYTKIT